MCRNFDVSYIGKLSEIYINYMESHAVFSRYPGFQGKFDNVIELIRLKQLRKDLDDGLLEKLLSFLQNELTTEELEIILHSTSILHLLTDILKSLNSEQDQHNSNLSSFTLRAFGIFLKSADLFEFFKKESDCLDLLVSICVKNSRTLFPLSCHAAILICIKNLTFHSYGRKFLFDNGYIAMIIPSLSASSYYVRKEAISFFALYLQNAAAGQDQHENLKMDFNDLIKEIVSIIVAPDCKDILSDSCSSILQICFDSSSCLPVLLLDHHHLLEAIHGKIASASNNYRPSTRLIQLMASCLTYRKNSSNCETVQLFIKKGYFCDAVLLSMEILIRNQKSPSDITEQMSMSVLQTVLWPITVVVDNDSSISSECYKIREDNVLCLSILRTSLSSLTKLASLLHKQVLSHVLTMCIKLLGAICHGSSTVPSFLSASRNTKLMYLILELLVSTFAESDISEISNEVIALVECLMFVLKGLFNSIVTCQALKLISIIIRQSCDADVHFYNVVKPHFSEILERKLFDPDWSIVDSALEILMEVVKGSKRNKLWETFLRERKFHRTAWDLGFESEAEGYVRASAISVINLICFCPSLFKELEEDRNITKMQIVDMLCVLSDHSDIFLQRACLSSLTQWLSDKDVNSQLKIFNVLTNIVQYSCDCHSKIVALRAWESVVCTSWDSTQAAFDTLNYLCRVGCGHSLLCAVKDYDNAVQCQAIQFLLKIRKSMLDVNLNETSLIKSCGNSFSRLNTSKEVGELQFPFVSEEEREIAIDDVLNMNTTIQICKIAKVKDEISTALSMGSSRKFECSLQQLWEVLWSKEIELSLKQCSTSSDLYASNPCMLLEDISAAKIKQDVVYQDIDCY